jgi:hypothetical protein
MKPGEIYPGPHRSQGNSFAFSWLDSIVPAPKPTWNDARERAIEAYRNGAGERALAAKMAELDSLGMQGIGLDSLAVYWGGPESIASLERGKGLPRFGGASLIDSLAFGGSRPPALNPGQVSGWLPLSSAVARVRLDRRAAPDPAAVATRVEADRRKLLDQKLHGYFVDLKRRYPVKILDPGLKDVGLPEPSRQ